MLDWITSDLMTGSRLLLVALTSVSLIIMSGVYRRRTETLEEERINTERIQHNSELRTTSDQSQKAAQAHESALITEQTRRSDLTTEAEHLHKNSTSAENFAKRGSNQMDSAAFPPIKDMLDDWKGAIETSQSRNPRRGPGRGRSKR